MGVFTIPDKNGREVLAKIILMGMPLACGFHIVDGTEFLKERWYVDGTYSKWIIKPVVRALEKIAKTCEQNPQVMLASI